MRTVMSTIVLLLALIAARPIAQDLEVELQRAIQQETATGDLEAAIEAYRRIADHAGGQREIAARALVHLADAYRKMGDAEARRVYERVLRDYADQKDAAALARDGLTRIAAPRGPSTAPATRQLWVGADTTGSVSTDGRLVSFTDWTTGDLMIRDLATNSSRRLTDTGGWNASGDYAEQSALSPDGRQVAYSWFTDKSPDRNSYDLRVLSIATAGSKPRVLYKPGPSSWIQPCAWTPDGRAILAQRDVRRDGADTREIVIVSVADGAVRAIKTLEAWSTRVAVSPDGRYIAYDAPESSNRARRDVFIIPLDGSREAVQIKHTADEASPVWSADGKRLLFISDRMGAVGLWGIRISGGRPEGDAELVDRSIDQLMGTDRDGRLYYTTGGARRNVYVAPVDASLKVTGAPVLFSDHAVNVAHGGAWSPDATRFAYYASRSVQTQQISALMIRTVATGEERAVIPGVPLTTPRWGGIRWFPDGRSLLVVGRDDLRVGEGLFRLDVATGALQLITRERGGAFGGYPSIAPDGTSIYYADRDERESVNTRIVRLDLASGTRTDLKTGFVTALALSPDGKQLAYLASPGGPTSRAMQIAVMPAAGGAERVLFEAADWYDGSRFSTLGWSADGRYVLFVPHQDGARNSIWRVPAAGGTAEKTGITATGRIKMPMESPGGGRLAYSVLEESPGELWVLENYLPPVKRSGS